MKLKRMILFFVLLITLSVRSENITFNDAMKNILLNYNSNSTNNHSTWFPKEMINILNCGSFPKLNNSKLSYILKWNEQKIFIEQRCDQHFEASRNIMTDAECLNGKWIYEDKQCKLITCPTFYKPAHSYTFDTSHTYNSIVYFSCFRGYILRGNTSMRCEENKQWSSPPPICEIIKCIPPQLKYGIISNTHEVGVNETINFSCLKPYVLKGDSVLTCLEDGEWNLPVPVCIFACIVPKIDGRVMNIQLEVLKPNSLIHNRKKLLYFCQPPYRPITSGFVQCFGNKWHPDIQCRKACTIEKLTELNFILSHNFSVIEYYCPTGKTLVGDSKRICLENGTWSGKLPICVEYCRLEQNFGMFGFRKLDNLQYLPFGSFVPEDTSLIYFCQQDYLNKTGNVTCQNGVLTPTPRCMHKNIFVINNKLVLRYNSSNHNICSKNRQLCDLLGFQNDNYCQDRYCYEGCVKVDYNKTSSKLMFEKTFRRCCQLRCY